MTAAPSLTLYAKLQDVDLTKFDREAMSKLQVLGFSLTDIIDDCITVKETKGFGNTETLDFLIPELNNTVFWNDDKDTYRFSLYKEKGIILSIGNSVELFSMPS